MNDVKGILQSRVVLSAMVALIGVLLNRFGYELAAGDQLVLVDTVSTVMGVVGSIGAILFRVKATKTIDPTKAVIKQ